MTLSYFTSTKEGSLRTIHKIVIDGKELTTTKAKDILIFAKPKIFSKNDWKQLKEAVKFRESLEIMGGDLFGLDDK